ncbi:MAG: flagellar biosynthetic protein FliO [Succinivibrio sp.]|nr:flagellar biosynthetic protein FliO [Succinivibrio sp.]
MYLKTAVSVFAALFCPWLTVDAEEANATLNSSSVGMLSGLLTWLVSTVAILAFIFLLAYLLKRSKFAMRRNGALSVVAQLPLGPKERVVELEVHGRRMLLGVTANNISFLTHIPDDLNEKDFAKELSVELKKEERDKSLDEKKQSE